MSLFWKAMVVLFVAYFAQFILVSLWKMGAFRISYNQKPGPCWTIPMNGSDGITLLPEGIAIISSGLRDPNNRYGLVVPPREGKLYMFDFNQLEKTTVHEIQLIESDVFQVKDFIPHGLSHWRDANTKETYLQIVNNMAARDTVEIFQLQSSNLVAKHIKTVTDPLFTYCLNDVSAVAKSSFYVSSDHRFESNILRQLEDFFQLSTSKVSFYDGRTETFHTAVENVKYANGVALSPDGRFLYVTSLTGASLLIFGRNQKTQFLEFLQEIEIGSICDNFFVEPTGDIWLGCLPKLLKVIECFQSTNNLCDSQVLLLKLGPKSDKKEGPPFPNYTLEQIYYDFGRQLKASSAAVHYKGQMLVGSAFDNLLYCQLSSLDQ